MTVNGVSVGTYHARQHKVVYGYPERNASFEWPTGCANPVFYRNTPNLETVTVELIVEGASREGIRSDIRQILGLFNTSSVNIGLTGGGYILGTLQGSTSQETSPQKWHKLILTLRGIAYQRIDGSGKSSRLPATLNVDASPIGGCQMILTLASDTQTGATITISGIAWDRKGNGHDISFRLPDIPGDGTNITVFIGELPAGLPYFAARENPAMISLADGTPINGNMGAMPCLKQGVNAVAVSASSLSYNGAATNATISCEFTIYYLSTRKEEP